MRIIKLLNKRLNRSFFLSYFFKLIAKMIVYKNKILKKNSRRKSNFLSAVFAYQAKVKKYFSKKRQILLKVYLKKYRFPIVVVLVLFILTVTNIGNWSASAATYTFNQINWAGGVSVDFATHPNDKSNWNKFQFKDANLEVVSDGAELQLSPIASSTIQTDNTASSTGFNLNGTTFSNTEISGSDINAGVKLSATYRPMDTRSDYSTGSNPQSVAFDPITNSIWVANYGSNNITKINATSGTIIGTYASGGSNPRAITFDSSTNSVWVVNYNSNNVTKINASTGNPIGTYTVGSKPQAITFDSSTNSVWVANNSSNNVTKLNASTGALVGTYVASTSPVAIAFDPSTNSVWVVNNGSSNVTKLNSSTGALIGAYTVSASPGAITFDSVTNSIWISSGSSNSIAKLDAFTGASSGVYSINIPRSITFDSVTNSIWVSQNNGNVTKLDASTGSISMSYFVGGTITASTFDPSANFVWVTNSSYNNVTKLNVTTKIWKYTTLSSTAITFDPSTKSIWSVGYYSSNVNKLDAVTGALIGTYALGKGFVSATFDSSTNSVWLANQNNNNVTKLNASTGVVIGTYAAGTKPQAIFFDPITNSIWVANYDSNNVTKLDAATGATIGTYSVGSGPQAITFDSVTNSIWVANNGSDNVTKLNASTGALIGTYMASTSPIAITFDSSTNSIWVANNGANSVTKLDVTTGALIGTYGTGGYNVRSVTFDPVNNAVWLTNASYNNVGKLNAATGALIGTYMASAAPTTTAFDPINNSIWVGSNTGFYKINITNILYLGSPGVYTSGAIDIGSKVSSFLTANFNNILPTSTSITIDVRAGNTSDPNDGSWTSWVNNITNGGSISSLGSNRYIQYKATLTTSDNLVSPSLNDISFGYESYPVSQVLISSPYNSTSNGNAIGGLGVTRDDSLPSGTSVMISIRTASSQADLETATWFDYTEDSVRCTENGGAINCPAVALAEALKSGGDDQWWQYKVTLMSDGSLTPTVSGVGVKYVVNNAPELNNVTVTNDNNGNINISYEVRDDDTLGGSNTPGKVTPSFEYWNGSSWVACTALAVDDTVNKNVDEVDFNTYTATWNYKKEFDNHYLEGAKIKVIVNDNEGVNNLAAVESSPFLLDTVNPVVNSVIVDARNDTENNLTFSAFDNTMSDLKIKISNHSDLSSDDLNSDSGVWLDYVDTKKWLTAGNNSVIYYQLKDKFGNLSLGGDISAIKVLNQPQNVIYQDVSSRTTEEWREFIAWSRAATPDFGFKQYSIYRSTDGENYTLIGTESDININFILDSNLDTTSRYYYKVGVEDLVGNISNYSNPISDRPDGQGGSDLTPPTITNVEISYITSQSALITWETDEPSNSSVSYITSSSGDFTDAQNVGVSSMVDNAAQLGKHSVFLNNLDPGITYYIQVESSDSSLNLATGGVDLSFTTLTGPKISDVSISGIQNTSASVTWTTSEPDSSHVFYSTDSTLANPIEVGTDDSTTNHHVKLSGLDSGVTYYFYVNSGIAEDRNIIHGVATYYSFATSLDVTSPVITFDPQINITNKTETSATISWETNEISTSTIEYSNDDYLWNVLNNFGLNTNHTFQLTGLTKGTLYRFRIKSTDVNSNQSVLDNQSFSTPDNSDITPPIISFTPENNITNITDTSVRISWTTNEIANSSISYSIDDSYDYVLTNNNFNTNNAFDLTGLTRGTTYNFRLSNSDASNNLATSTSYTFTTEDNSDTVPPTISNIKAEKIADTSAIISWSTNESSNSLVEYGVETLNYVASSSDSNYNFSHSLILSNLKAKTKYYYKITSLDRDNNVTSSSELTFTTVDTLIPNSEAQAQADAMASQAAKNSSGGGVLIIDKTDKISPVISNVEVKDISSKQAIVSWQTNESASSIVEYGVDDSYGLASVNLTPSINHEQKLISLFPSILYYYKITSVDTSGNLSDSSIGTFLTLSFNPIDLISTLNNNPTSTLDTVNQAEAESNFSDILRRTFDFIKQAAKTVSIATLEASLLEQQNNIKDLVGLTPSPSIVTQPKVQAWEDMAVISWETDKKTNSLINYSENGIPLTDANRAQVVGNPDAYSLKHQVVLSGLKAETKYNYEVRGSTAIGSYVNFSSKTFTTPAKSAKVDNYVADRLSDDSASFKWTSSLPTNTSVRVTPYRNNTLSYDEARVLSDPKMISIHEMTVDDLEPGTFYKVDLFGTDKSGKIISQTIETFSSANKELPFTITQVKTSSALATGEGLKVQSIISWDTTKLSTSKIYYRKGTSRDENIWPLESPLDSGYTRHHIVVLTAFAPGEVYQFQVESVDSNGQKVRSKTYTILTPSQQESVFQLIFKNFEQTFGWMNGSRN